MDLIHVETITPDQNKATCLVIMNINSKLYILLHVPKWKGKLSYCALSELHRLHECT